MVFLTLYLSYVSQDLLQLIIYISWFYLKLHCLAQTLAVMSFARKKLVCAIFNYHKRYANPRQMSARGKHLIAVCQTTASADKTYNVDNCSKMVTEAAEKNAKIAFLPESFDFIVSDSRKKIDLAERIDGPIVCHFQELAKSLNIWISLGGLHEKGPDTDSDKIYITHILINNLGQITGLYRKCHLFDIRMKDGPTLLESKSTLPGQDITPPIYTPCGKIGLQICYDIRFPEQANVLTQQGADILTFPSAFTFVTGMAHWEVLLRARAIENQCYVVAAAQVGSHDGGRQSFGHSIVVDPWGTIVAEQKENGPGVLFADIDLEYLGKVRARMPVFQHRRYDLYNNPLLKGTNR